MTPSIESWIALAVEQSGTVPPLQPHLPSCERLLDSTIPSGECDALEEEVWQALDTRFPWLSMVGQDSNLHADEIDEFARLICWLKTSIANWGATTSNLAEIVFTMALIRIRSESIEAMPQTLLRTRAHWDATRSVIYQSPYPHNAHQSLMWY